ncbi:MAG: exonuclease V subunit gamma, partial [Acidimicrobiia bacterium]|nr:exonuclease V subunit gamma [Acidimicrobiia bacterium]
MSFHLTVGGSLEPLADALAELLAVPAPGADPFDAELVLVPSAGVRAWLGARLARRLGATARGGDGVVAN